MISTRTLLKGSIALLLAVPATAVATNASAAPTPGVTIAAKVTTPQLTVGCNAFVENPFFVVSGGDLYGSSWITDCTNPAPTSCRVTTDLEKIFPTGTTGVVDHGDSGWGACTPNKKINTEGYGCPGGRGKASYQVLSTLTIQYGNQTGGTAKYGNKVTEPCE